MGKRINIAYLVIIHLLVLFYPQMVKSVHVHHDVSACCRADHGVSVDTRRETCPVCDFEFISFIQTPATRLQVCLPVIQVADFPATESAYPSLHYYLSLRAPPVA